MQKADAELRHRQHPQGAGGQRAACRALAGDSWGAWLTLLIAAMGERLTDDERIVFTKLTGREREPMQAGRGIHRCGRQARGQEPGYGTLSAYIAGLCKHPWSQANAGCFYASRPDQRQASIVLEYCAAAFEQSPILKQLIERRTPDALELNNGISIEVRAGSFRAARADLHCNYRRRSGVLAHRGFSEPDVEF